MSELIILFIFCFCCVGPVILAIGSSGAFSKPFPDSIQYLSLYLQWFIGGQYVNRSAGESCPPGYDNNNGLLGPVGCIKQNTFRG
jgi:hypothetical protein